jgi:hypothetical protein
MSSLTTDEKLNLSKLIRDTEADDNTEKIRRVRHSGKIKENVEIFLNLKKKYARLCLIDKNKFKKIVMSHCNFLWTTYTNIFNRLVNDELDIRILYKFIFKLEEIENGVTDQHEASVDIGKILKELYIDIALRREKNYEEKENNENNKNKKKKIKERKPISNITWNTFKKMDM